MSKKLYVGNIPYTTTDTQLQELFGQAGEVASVTLINDRDTGRPKGFGFVEMSTEEAAKAAIEKFNGYSLDGRAIVVNEARPQEARPQRDNSYRGGNNFNRGNGGYRNNSSYSSDRNEYD